MTLLGKLIEIYVHIIKISQSMANGRKLLKDNWRRIMPPKATQKIVKKYVCGILSHRNSTTHKAFVNLKNLNAHVHTSVQYSFMLYVYEHMYIHAGIQFTVLYVDMYTRNQSEHTVHTTLTTYSQ
jgi:hypothetical protein